MQQLKHSEVGCRVLITLALGQGVVEVNCVSPVKEEEGGISSKPLAERDVLLLLLSF